MRLAVGRNRFGLLAGITVLLLIARLFTFQPAGAVTSTLPNRFLKLSDPLAGQAGVVYQLGFDTSSSNTIGSVELEICSNDPFPGTSCTVPAGLDVSSATLISQSGTNDFVIDPVDTNAHRIVFTRVPSLVVPMSFTFEMSNVSNPSAAGSIYGRIRTFSGANEGGAVNNSAGLAIGIHGSLSLSTEVPPHIDLCVGVTITNIDCSNVIGDTVDFGKLRTDTIASSTSQIVAGTNADNGYTITISGNTMTSGNHTIRPLSSLSTAIPGTSQFGLNLRKNMIPNTGAEPAGLGSATPVGNYTIPDSYAFNNGDTIVSASGPDNYKRFTVTYIIDIDHTQSAGFYATSLAFVALGNF